MTLATICLVVIVLSISGLAGYLGWFLSHKSYSDGFTLGYNHGRQEMYDQLKPTPPTLRPVK